MISIGLTFKGPYIPKSNEKAAEEESKAAVDVTELKNSATITADLFELFKDIDVETTSFHEVVQ